VKTARTASSEPRFTASSAGRSLNGRRSKRERIVAAGLKLFANQPYQRVTMDKVAKLARVAKGTLYLYFPSKESLYLGILSDGLNEAVESMRAKIAPRLDIAERLQHAIAETIEFYHDRGDFLRLLATEEPRVGAARGRLLQSWRESGMKFFSAMIEEGIADGAFRPLDPRVVAFAIIGTIRLVLLHRDTNRPVAEINRDLASLLFDGLSVRGKTQQRSRRQ
jgi:AcrR family transcriptional regulator